MSLELQFRRYIIELIVEYLSRQGRNGGATLTRETTLAVYPFGQFTQTPSGVRYTPKQGNLLPRRGLETNVLTVNGKHYVSALGDTRKRQPARVTPSRSGGAFPRLPLPFQPVVRDLAAWVSWHKYSVFGKYDELPGLLAIPHGPRLEVPPFGTRWNPNDADYWQSRNPPRAMLLPEPEATIEARAGVRYIYGSQWMDPASTEIPPWRMRRYLGKPMPMGLAYCMALVDGRLSIQSHPWTPWEGGQGIGYSSEDDAPYWLPVPERLYGVDNLVVDELISPGTTSGSVTFEGGLYSPSGEADASGFYADLTPLFGSHVASFSVDYGVAVFPSVQEDILSLFYDNSDQEVDRRFRYVPFRPEFSNENIRYPNNPQRVTGAATYLVEWQPGSKYGSAFYKWRTVKAQPNVFSDVPESGGDEAFWGPIQADFVSNVLYFDTRITPFDKLVGCRVLWSVYLSDPNLQSQGNPEAVVVSVEYGVQTYPGRYVLITYGQDGNTPTNHYLTATTVWTRVTFDRPVGMSKQNGAYMGEPAIVSGDYHIVPTDDPFARTYAEEYYQAYSITGVEVTRTHEYLTAWTPKFEPSPSYSREIFVEYSITMLGAFMVYAGVSGDEYSVYYEPGFEALTAMRANGGNYYQGSSAAPGGMNVLIRDEGSYSLTNGSTEYSVDRSPIGTGSLAARAKMRDIPALSDPFTLFRFFASNTAERITGPGQKKQYSYFTAPVALQKRRKVTDLGGNHDGARPLDDPDAEATTYLMTEKKREIAAQTNPLLYRGQHGLLVNPFIKASDRGPENYFTEVGEDYIQALVQSWFGLTWPLGWYVADAAIIAIPEPDTGTPVDHTVAAVIYPAPANSRDNLDDYLLIISVDGVPVAQGGAVKTWSVFDFFPGSVVTDPDTQQVTAREMFFLDRQRWPDVQRVNVKPNYNFLREGSGWPLRNTLWLEPFAMRLRDLKQDKFGPADCGFTLFLDTVYVQD